MQSVYLAPTPSYESILEQAFNRQPVDQELESWMNYIRKQQAALPRTAPVPPEPQVVAPSVMPVPKVQAPVLKHPSEISVSRNGKRGKPQARYEKLASTLPPRQPQRQASSAVETQHQAASPGKPQPQGSTPRKPQRQVPSPVKTQNPASPPRKPQRQAPSDVNRHQPSTSGDPPRQARPPGNPRLQSSPSPKAKRRVSPPGEPPRQARNVASLQGQASSLAPLCQRPKPEVPQRQAACRTWNNGGTCRYLPCWFRHECERCGSSAHPRVHHDRAILAQRA